MIWVLLVPLVAGLVLWTYGEVRTDLLTAAGTRMEGSAHDVGALFERAATTRLRYVRRFADEREALRAQLRDKTEATAAAAQEALDNLARLMRVPAVAELWTEGGRLLLSGRGAPDGEEAAALALAEGATLPASLGYQPLRMVGSLLVTEIVAAVTARGSETGNGGTAEATAGAANPETGGDARLGYLVLRRAITASSGAEMLGRLMGVRARFMVGNRSGDFWTDLTQPVAPPSVDPLNKQQRFFTAADGSQRIGAGIEIRESPWVLWVESDAGEPLARASRLLIRMLVFGGLLLVAGGLGAWWLSRRVTLPLREATEAAEAIAAGHYGHRLPVRRKDEVGRLVEAFNVMAARVEEARADLEARVAARTSEVSEALRRLQDAQDELVRSEKLATLGQLAGSVGHELRNPLGVMSNAIYYLELVDADAAPEVREYLGILRRQVSLAEKIVADLLDFTRQGQPQRRSIELRQLVDEQIARLGGLPIEVVVDVAADLPRIWADQVQVGQVVFNLLTNAMQALEGRPGGRIAIIAKATEGSVRLEVADNGKGIPEELHEKVFEPLFTTRARGIGLGLAVSRRLARNNGGDLALDPPAGGGARFVLALPVAQPVEQNR